MVLGSLRADNFLQERKGRISRNHCTFDLSPCYGPLCWELKVAPQIVEAKPPTLDELMIIRLVDPKGIYLRG